MNELPTILRGSTFLEATEEAGYGSRGEFIGLDVKAMRTQKGDRVTAHLTGSWEIFLHLVDKVRSWDRKLEQQMIDARDYEALELAVMRHLMGIKVILFHFHPEHTDETVSS